MPNLQADLAAHCIRLEQENEKLKADVAMLRAALKTHIEFDIGHPLGIKNQLFNAPMVTEALSATATASSDASSSEPDIDSAQRVR